MDSFDRVILFAIVAVPTLASAGWLWFELWLLNADTHRALVLDRRVREVLQGGLPAYEVQVSGIIDGIRYKRWVPVSKAQYAASPDASFDACRRVFAGRVWVRSVDYPRRAVGAGVLFVLWAGLAFLAARNLW